MEINKERLEQIKSVLVAEVKFFFNVIKESFKNPTQGSVVISTTSGSVVSLPDKKLNQTQ